MLKPIVFQPNERRGNLTFLRVIPREEHKKIYRLIELRCDCGNLVTVTPSEFGLYRFCRQCWTKSPKPDPVHLIRSGEDSPNWKGGRTMSSNGYVLVIVGKGHHLAITEYSHYAYEHRVEAEKKLGRELLPGEIVHHKDEDKTNNSHNNLVIVQSDAEHKLHHRNKHSERQRPDEPNTLVDCACGCGGNFLKFDATKRPRRFLPGHFTGNKVRSAS